MWPEPHEFDLSVVYLRTRQAIRGKSLREQFMNHSTMHVGQAEVSSTVAER